MGITGHLSTVGWLLRRHLRPPTEPPFELWRGAVSDPALGRVRLTGRLSGDGGGPLILAVHGLGGSAGTSRYLWDLASVARERGWSVLRIDLRGADRRGEDLYHAGLTDDLHAALASPALANYGPVAVVGFSLGGHVVLRLACEPGDGRVKAAAAVCPPLDLAAGQRALDRPGARIYRHYVMRHLKEIYREVAARGSMPLPLPVEEAEALETLWSWDETIVSRRHGFAGADDYYARASVASRLGGLRLPALLLASEDDPMVPAETLRPWLDPRPPGLEVRWRRRGGHVGFPARLDLGYGSRGGLSHQLVAWCERAVR